VGVCVLPWRNDGHESINLSAVHICVTTLVTMTMMMHSTWVLNDDDDDDLMMMMMIDDDDDDVMTMIQSIQFHPFAKLRREFSRAVSFL